MLLILDNLAGHKTPEFVCWLMDHGVMPLYTPLGGSWLNTAESVQSILVSRALGGQRSDSPEQIVGWLEATALAWNRSPAPFVWGGSVKPGASGHGSGGTRWVVPAPARPGL